MNKTNLEKLILFLFLVCMFFILYQASILKNEEAIYIETTFLLVLSFLLFLITEKMKNKKQFLFFPFVILLIYSVCNIWFIKNFNDASILINFIFSLGILAMWYLTNRNFIA